MKNARMHEALCLLFPTADTSTAWKLEQGPHTNFEIAITEWNLPDPQPTQAELDAVYEEIRINDALSKIDADFFPKEDELKSLMATAMLSGDEGGSKVVDLRLKWASLVVEKNAAIKAALMGV